MIKTRAGLKVIATGKSVCKAWDNFMKVSRSGHHKSIDTAHQKLCEVFLDPKQCKFREKARLEGRLQPISEKYVVRLLCTLKGLCKYNPRLYEKNGCGQVVRSLASKNKPLPKRPS